MKRSDLTTAIVLDAVDVHGVWAWEVLVESFPPKIVLAAMEREVAAGNLEYGVTLRRPWLTDKGRAVLNPDGHDRNVIRRNLPDIQMAIELHAASPAGKEEMRRLLDSLPTGTIELSFPPEDRPW